MRPSSSPAHPIQRNVVPLKWRALTNDTARCWSWSGAPSSRRRRLSGRLALSLRGSCCGRSTAAHPFPHLRLKTPCTNRHICGADRLAQFIRPWTIRPSTTDAPLRTPRGRPKRKATLRLAVDAYAWQRSSRGWPTGWRSGSFRLSFPSECLASAIAMKPPQPARNQPLWIGWKEFSAKLRSLLGEPLRRPTVERPTSGSGAPSRPCARRSLAARPQPHGSKSLTPKCLGAGSQGEARGCEVRFPPWPSLGAAGVVFPHDGLGQVSREGGSRAVARHG